MMMAQTDSTGESVATGNGPVLLGYQQAAKALSIGQRTLADLVAKGEIPVVRIRARVLFRREALSAWAAAQESAGPVATTG